MPSEQKTISIDPDLFVNTERSKTNSGNNTNLSRETLRRPKKVKPKIPKGPSSNTLRKNLLARIKEHQMREQREFKKPVDNNKKNNETKTPHDFEDEFSKSLAYLSELAKATDVRRQEKRRKGRNTLTLKTSSNVQNLHNATSV